MILTVIINIKRTIYQDSSLGVQVYTYIYIYIYMPLFYATKYSRVPDDGCINVRNMLSIEEVK